MAVSPIPPATHRTTTPAPSASSLKTTPPKDSLSSMNPSGSFSPSSEVFARIRNLFIAFLSIVLQALSNLRNLIDIPKRQIPKASPLTAPPAVIASSSTTESRESPAPPTLSNLPITDEEKAIIYTLIHTIGTASWLQLLSQANTMHRYGQEIAHVHPLQFLAYILSDSTLTQDLKNIFENVLKKTGFLPGLSRQLSSEMEAGRLLPYLPSFAEAVGVDYAALQPLAEQGQWEAFIMHLLQRDPEALPSTVGITLIASAPSTGSTSETVLTASTEDPTPATSSEIHPAATLEEPSFPLLNTPQTTAIRTLLEHIARDNLWQLGRIQGTLRACWIPVQGISPLCFINHLLNPENKQYVRMLLDQQIAGRFFWSDVEKHCNQEMASCNLTSDLSCFCRLHPQISEARARYLIDKKEWKKLIREVLILST